MLADRGALALILTSALFLLPSCPSAPVVETDASASGPCAADADCDDGRFCNGEEQCAPDAGSADVRGCTPGTAACAAADCDEAANTCSSGCAVRDRDGDGSDAPECGGADCDDDDPNRTPGGAEVCDAADVDEDCDPRTFGVRDLDLDGDADALCCNVAVGGMRTCGRDCDDTRAGVGPSSTEVCNAIDDDCDAAVDEGGTMTFYRDVDADGHGDASDVRTDLCGPTGEYSATIGDDCDDADPLVFPSARELCNGEDDDCSSGGGAERAEDGDGDGHTSETYTGCESIPSSMQLDDCNDTNPDFHPGAPFQHAPFCVVSESCRRVFPRPPGWTCGVRRAGSYDCATELGSGGALDWDYDCSGRDDPEVALGAAACSVCLGGSGACTVCLARDAFRRCVEYLPAGEMFLVAAAAECGADATYANCMGTCGGTCSQVVVPPLLPMRCR